MTIDVLNGSGQRSTPINLPRRETTTITITSSGFVGVAQLQTRVDGNNWRNRRIVAFNPAGVVQYTMDGPDVWAVAIEQFTSGSITVDTVANFDTLDEVRRDNGDRVFYVTQAGPVCGTTTEQRAVGLQDIVIRPVLSTVAAIGVVGNGFFVKTGAETYAARTLTGTASRLSVTNGAGGANPVFDIDAAYVGQATITTLGTITTGTWNGTAIAANRGGTGQTVYAVGDLLYASTTTALSKLAGVATGNALISGGVNTAPAWGKVGLTTHVSGILPVANGGTGVASPAGTYTPTATALTNCTAALPQGTSQWMRVGNVVAVSGQIRLQATAGALAVCEARISLPVPTALTAGSNQIAGTANATFTAGSAQIPGVIYANVTFDEAVIRFNAPDTNQRDFWYHFMYEVV